MAVYERQQAIIKKFSFFENWNDKYIYLISFRRILKNVDLKRKSMHVIHGCQSSVWFNYSFIDDKVNFQAFSNSTIVSGIIGLLIEVYSNSEAIDILSSNTKFLNIIGFSQHVSSMRNNGLYFMLNYIYKIAARHVK